jgi:hypothetical protein
MSERTASYKGKTYRLLFMGKTRFGERAKLAFMDGSKVFWVKASAVEETTGTRRFARVGLRPKPN